jgi:RNA polymerase sigma factor (sigma-70 family)
MIERIKKQRDPQAFAALYGKFAPVLFRQVLLPKLGDAHAANDVLAETFERVLARFHQFESQDLSMYFWIKTIATNLAMDWHRRNARTHRALDTFERMMAAIGESTTAMDLTFQNAESGESEIRSCIDRVLGTLNERYRNVIHMRFFDEIPRIEAADKLGISVATFDVLMLRALRAFAKNWITTFGEKPHVSKRR